MKYSVCACGIVFTHGYFLLFRQYFLEYYMTGLNHWEMKWCLTFSLLWEFDLKSVVCFFGGDTERYFNVSGAVELSLLRWSFSRLMTIQVDGAKTGWGKKNLGILHFDTFYIFKSFFKHSNAGVFYKKIR